MRGSIEAAFSSHLLSRSEAKGKTASVGMFEHVGRKLLPAYFEIAHRILKPGGVFLNHCIARSRKKQSRNLSFIDRYVFPDGELVPIAEALEDAERAGFEVRDVENLREHYTKTLRLWVRGLQGHKEQVLDYVSLSTYRIWTLYMAGSATALERGDIGIYQTVLLTMRAVH